MVSGMIEVYVVVIFLVWCLSMFDRISWLFGCMCVYNMVVISLSGFDRMLVMIRLNVFFGVLLGRVKVVLMWLCLVL